MPVHAVSRRHTPAEELHAAIVEKLGHPMTRRVHDLRGVELDYWVARADGHGPDVLALKPGGLWCGIDIVPNAIRPFPACVLGHRIGRRKRPWQQCWYYPSTVWTNGGPIVQREGIRTSPVASGEWIAQLATTQVDADTPVWFGPTLLVAAMRCFVASRFGDTVPEA